MEGNHTFTSFDPPFPEVILDVIQEMGFSQMTPVQAATIPHFISNKDVLVQACTGSGKTLSFILPILVKLLRREFPLKNREVGSLVISPTRELARQIFDVASRFTSRLGINIYCMTGGGEVSEDLSYLASHPVHLMVATPGRLEDILTRHPHEISMKELDMLIMDEADTLLDLGHSQSINSILSLLPKQRRTGLFSATQTRAVKELARAGLRNPVSISVQVQSSQDVSSGQASRNQITPLTLSNFYLMVDPQDKINTILSFLVAHREQKILLFMLTCASVDFYTDLFMNAPIIRQYNIRVDGLHGKMVQKKRIGVYDHFVASESGVLLCTDVAARGIDIPDVDWIIQFDTPKDPNFFVHRIGRTARAGREGSSLTLIQSHEDAYLEFLRNRQVPIQELPVSLIPSPLPQDVIASLKNLIRNDRALLEKGTNAFISYIRGYREHQLQFIFRFHKVDLGQVANQYLLLQLPRIGELKGRVLENFIPDTIDVSKIKYKKKEREQARVERLRKIAEEKAAMDQANPHEEGGPTQRKKRPLKNEAQQQANEPPAKRKRKGKHQRIMEEWDDLQKEERLFKKLKKGKISNEQYDALLRGEMDEEDLYEDD